MLSDQTSHLRRRQNSTPTPTDVAPKASLFPAAHRPQHGSHRRGLSLDQRPRHQSLQDNGTTSTITGPNQQHVLREAQQQPQARPGQYQQRTFTNVRETQSFPFPQTPPPVTADSSNPIDDLESPDYFEILKNLQEIDFEFFQSSDANTSSNYLDGFEEAFDKHIADMGSSDISGEVKPLRINASLRRDVKHSIKQELPLRPSTPQNQINTSYFPMTPAATPFARSSKAQRSSYSRTAQSSPTRRDFNETIKAPKAAAMKRGSSYHDVFDDMRNAASHQGLPSPPNTVPLPSSSTFEFAPTPARNFLNMSGLDVEFPAKKDTYDSSNYSPMSNRISPNMSSFQTSPELAPMDLFDDLNETMPSFEISSQQSRLVTSQSAMDLGSCSPYIKAESVQRSQSISDITLDPSIDASIEDTGITVDEIASFIHGPDTADGKWTCLFPACNKKFGRKENIKSHVQTHLGDRQFRCNHCQKCFVRQHDLKRHSKIHSGVKPYPCACGNSFARHDALTRHRQRGVCIGAIEGMPKKEVKRGRPKKMNRPDTEERREKAARTRQRVLEKTYASSMSGSSECSVASPQRLYDDIEIRGSSPFDNFQQLDPISCGASPDLFSYTPPASPGYSAENRFSPRHSHQSYTPKASRLSPSPKQRYVTSVSEQIDNELPSQGSPCKSVASHYGTPPELDLSSSSPAASRFFDFYGGLEIAESTIHSTSTSQSNNSSDGFDLPQLNHNIEDAFFEMVENETSMTSLERDPTLLLDKFEQPSYSNDPWSDEYMESSDPFFGSP